MASPAIDLSAGMVPAQAPPQTQRQAAAPVDLSAGMVPTQQPDAATQSDPGMLGQYMDDVKRRATLHGVKDRIQGLIEGAHTGVDETALGIGKILRSTPLIGDVLAKHGLDDASFAQMEGEIAKRSAGATNEDRAGGQQIGSSIESMVEFMAGDAALKGLPLVQKLKQLAPIEKALKSSPTLTRILGNAIAAGTVGGGQTLAKGGTIGDAAESAAVQTGTAGLLEGVPEGALHMAESVKPGARTIEGVRIPTLASQEAGATARQAASASLEDTPEYAAKQQEGAKQVISNIAQRATRDGIDRLNATRPVPETNPARLLPAPEDMKPYEFTMSTGEPTETVDHGPQTGGRDYYEGAGSRAYQSTPPAAGQGSVTRGGGGTVTTSDPAEAHAAMSKLDTLIESDSFANLSPKTQAQYQTAADSLRQQITDYGANRAKMSHFDPIDSAKAAAQVGNFRDAAEVMQAGVKPVYAKLDEVSDGQWGQLRKLEQGARQNLRNTGSETAEARLAEVQAKQQSILADAKGQISEPEWRAANRAYRDGAVLNTIHDTLESSFRGASAQGADRAGLDRTLDGNKMQNGLRKLLNKRRDDVERVIGPDGADNLERMADLLKTPDSAARAHGHLQAIGMHLRRYGEGVGAVLGGFAGHGLAGALGHAGIAAGGLAGVYGGRLAGAAIEGGYKSALHGAATNPAVAERLATAVKRNVAPRTAGPLIAAMMNGQLRDQQADDQTGP